MWKQASLFALVAALAACSGDGSPNPINGKPQGGTTDPTDPTEPQVPDIIIPADFAGNLDGVTLQLNGDGDADDQLIVTGVPLDDGQIGGVYSRAPEEDLPGYRAFYKQDDRLDRIFVALTNNASPGGLRAYAVGDGGQFDFEFGGILIERDGEFTPPDVGAVNGLVSYAGLYAAQTDLADPQQNLAMNPFGANGDQAVPVDSDGFLIPETIPLQPRTIKGKVFMNVDFADNVVNGAIGERTWSDGRPIGDERYLLLSPGDIDASGNFSGGVQQRIDAEPDLREVGSYIGTFGGENAAGMGGAFFAENHIRVPDVDNPGEFIDAQDSTERGIWVIPRCDSANADPVCGELNDVEGLIESR